MYKSERNFEDLPKYLFKKFSQSWAIVYENITLLTSSIN